MASLNFEETIVLILFAQSGGTLTPTQADIVQFDAGLQNQFGADLQRIMTEEGLGISVHTRSAVLGCRPHMPGGTSALQIRAACRYLLSAHQAVAAAPPIAVAPQAAILSPAPKRARRTAARGVRRKQTARRKHKGARQRKARR